MADMPSWARMLGRITRGGQTDKASPETSPGSPTYDARIDPAISGPEILAANRLQQQRDLHLFDSKSAPALAFSNAYASIPSPLAAQMMGLAQQRDQIERVTSRRDLPPFPGVELGHVPAFANSPSSVPVLGGVSHLTHAAHLGSSRNLIEQGRTGRRKFGH
jgi:hypothetical protein